MGGHRYGAGATGMKFRAAAFGCRGLDRSGTQGTRYRRANGGAKGRAKHARP